MKKRAFILTAALSLLLSACAKEAASVGVIGGADLKPSRMAPRRT